MTFDFSVVGVESPRYERSWTSSDALLYALGVGAGSHDPVAELAYTTENSAGIDQVALPTLAVLVGSNGELLPYGDFDPSMLVHAEQSFELHEPLAVEGSIWGTSQITGIYDKGSGALVTYEHNARDRATDRLLISSRGSLFIRGAGGFGGAPAPASSWTEPEGPPDHEVTVETREDQALLYRLTGDRNPLHSDPAFARQAGFDRPILHGLCTYGIAGRILVECVAGSDPRRVVKMGGRFTSVVFPGDALTVSVWKQGTRASYRVRTKEGTVVLDRGWIEIADRPTPG